MPRSRQSASQTPAYQQLDPPRWWEFRIRLVSSSQPAAGGGREISANGFSPVQSWLSMLRLNLTALAQPPRFFVTQLMNLSTSILPQDGSSNGRLS
ncbi:hypothetical protein CPAR01_01357 [Colletotrichum paranaense]|uniref:Uncharacterized protein n=1 Tax=Colletotrichum paranaense TaxID=1914294 RepID=A0ABQ9T6L3_9PEZI|nr:uncharacterized protein CPAR01_01357 [Colletotrichum paranaense]KAK1547390.1 hypothetical protein CPAR01_01357 [Colletotrichum paranaense]